MIRKHKYDCDEKPKNKKDKTASPMHHLGKQHNFDFNNVKFLERQQNDYKGILSEMEHNKINNTVICRTDTQNLSSMYASFLNIYEKRIIKENIESTHTSVT